jgi:hypothetical protein
MVTVSWWMLPSAFGPTEKAHISQLPCYLKSDFTSSNYSVVEQKYYRLYYLIWAGLWKQLEQRLGERALLDAP